MKDEQIFYVSFGGSLPREYTLADLQKFAVFCLEYPERIEVPVKIGTRWQGWPVA